MGLKQIKDSDRIPFLNVFAREMLFNLSEKDRAKFRIETEKIKQKLITPSSNLISSNQLSSNQVLQIFSEYQNEEIQDKTQNLEPSKYQVTKEAFQENRKPITHRQDLVENPEHIRQMIRSKFMQPKTPVQSVHPIQPIQPFQTYAKTGISGYKKILPLLSDPVIQQIECPGPGKNLLVRRYNQTNITKTVLSQQEITDIIDEYSNQARIPVAGGILKAAVGNIMISALTSEFVGSRFIITKATPYSLIYS